ncbi:MAG: M23 family metallopeptidase [Anaerolineales bacterium]|nr:M23 family metallopeptidase [Anaerolineales bacterium]MBP6209515.1 M23 family metallopeptidase [Anaerolineales bacterium]
MQNNFNEDSPNSGGLDAIKPSAENKTPSDPIRQPGLVARWVNSLVQMGLGESLLRIGTNLFSVVAIVAVIFLVQAYYRQSPDQFTENSAQASGPEETVAVDINSIPAADIPVISGISRSAQIHTNVPSRPREEMAYYTVLDGDTVFGIAEKFGLEPQTVLWANYNLLLDDPHSLKPGQELNILPVDGVYWEWLGGIPFGQWAKFYGVTAAEVIEYPGNELDRNAVGDYENANIPTGTWLIIPGGKREFVSWSAPLGVTRDNPASARVLGPGACDPVSGGAVGYGTYVYPTNKHYLSGFDFSEKTNHRGLDFAGNTGEAVYATDAGVIVYSGWNNYGYGNMIMIDHGNGFQSLYAHLSELYRGCGTSVGQGESIGAVGSTGRSSGSHLHFELMAGVKVNPWDYLPPP